MLVTFGEGLKQPLGHRVEVAGVEGLAQALESATGAVEGWWSPHTWREDYRDSEAWEGASCIGIDLDLAGHAPLPVDVAVQLEQLAGESALSGSIFHRTPAGARLIFVLAATCTDPADYVTMARGAARGVEDDLREHGLDHLGLTIDPKPHADLGRLYFNPNTIAKGTKRSARVVIMRPLPYPAQNLRELAPAPEERATPATTARRLQAVSDPAKRAAAWVAKVPAESQGNRDNTAFRIAAALRRDFNLSESEAEPILREWCFACTPPLTEADVRRVLRSGEKNGKHTIGAKLLEERTGYANGTSKSGAQEGQRHAAAAGNAGQQPPWDPAANAAAGPEPTPPPDTAEEPARGIPLIRACDVVERPVEWVIENFLAKGELTDLSGDPGVGKGGICCSWAARVTREHPDASVIFFATEDPLHRVRARLRAEGADLARVLFLDISQPNANPILPGDIAQVEALVVEHRAALLVLDPALEFMQADLDSHKQQDVARFMGPLLAVAMRTGAALLTVRHNNKNAGASALHRASGSIGFTGKVRVALTAAKNHDTGERALAVTKNNLGNDRHTVGYSIVARDGASVITWGEVLEVTADELVNQEPAKKRGPKPAKLEAAMDVVQSILSGGLMKVEDVVRCAKSEGIPRATVYDAAAALKVEKLTLETRRAWRLPLVANSDMTELETPTEQG